MGFNLILQVAIDSAVTGSIYLLASLGFSMTYGLSRFPNTAQGDFMTFGGYISYFVTLIPGITLLEGVASASLVSGTLALISYVVVFKPILRRGDNWLYLTIASFAFSLVLRYVYLQLWGNNPYFYNINFQTFNIGSAEITSLSVYTIISAVALAVLIRLMLDHTMVGKAMRGTADNEKLAMISSVNTERIKLVTWFLSGALAGIGGSFLAGQAGVFPFMGFDLLFIIFGVVVLGGIGNFYGVIVASFILGVTDNFGTLLLNDVNISGDIDTIIGFFVVVAIIMIRPKGLSGIWDSINSRRKGASRT